MSYTREDALILNDEKIKIEKVSFISDFDILLAQKVNEKLGLPEISKSLYETCTYLIKFARFGVVGKFRGIILFIL